MSMMDPHTAIVPRPDRSLPAASPIKELLTTVTDEASRSWVYRGFGLLVAWSIALAGAVIALVLPDRYTARAQIYVNTDTLLRPLLKGLAVDTDPKEQVSILQKTLLTDVNLSKVLLQGDEDLKVATRADLASAIEDLRSQIRIDGVGNQLFSISFDGYVPDRARQIVQSLLTIFIESNLGTSRTDMQTARDFLDQQITTNQAQVAAAGQKLADFRAAHVNVLGQTDFSARLSAARIALQDATLELQAVQQVRKTLKARLQSTDAFMTGDTAPSQIVVGDQLIVTAIDRINTLRAQLQALRLRFTDDYPDVIATRNELAALVKQYSADDAKPARSGATAPSAPLASPAPSASPTSLPAAPLSLSDGQRGIEHPTAIGPAQVVPGAGSIRGATAPSATTPNPEYAEIKAQLIKAELSILEAEAKVSRTQTTLSSLESEAQNAPPIEAELAALTQQFESAKKNYEDLLPRRESARMSQAMDTTVDVVQFRIVEPPTVPAKPSGPNRNIILFIGTLIALVGGGFGAFSRGALAGAVVSARDLAATYGLPVIATIGSPGGALRRVQISFQVLSLLIAVSGIVVAMLALGFVMPAFEPYRFKIYELIYQMLHL